METRGFLISWAKPEASSLEVVELLRPPPLDLQLLERGEIAEHGDAPQDARPRRRAGADTVQMTGRVVASPGEGDLRVGDGAPVGHRPGQRLAQAGREHRGRLEPHVGGEQPREMLGRAVEQRDPARRVDGHHPAVDGGHDVLHVLVGEDDLGVELGVLHRDARLVGQGGEQVEIVGIVGIARPLGPERDRADDGVVRSGAAGPPPSRAR